VLERKFTQVDIHRLREVGEEEILRLKMADEKILTVPLRKEFLKAPKYARTKKAVNVLRSFLEKHLKKEVKIGKHLNLEMWKNGRKNPPGKIKVRIDEIEDYVVAELIDAPKVEVKEDEEKITIKKPKILSGKESSDKKDEKPKKTIKKVDQPSLKSPNRQNDDDQLNKSNERNIDEEKNKKAIDKISKKDVTKFGNEKYGSKPDERKHAHRKQEKIIAGKE
jgi:large subunit ribosomal protein L31e